MRVRGEVLKHQGKPTVGALAPQTQSVTGRGDRPRGGSTWTPLHGLATDRCSRYDSRTFFITRPHPRMSDTLPAGRGGARAGAGRKLGSGPHGEPTQPMRLPLSTVPVVRAWLSARASRLPPADALVFTPAPSVLPLPLYGARIAAGFPSPADDDIEASIDLNQHLVSHPAATFFVRVQGDSMVGAGIHNGDLLVVDRALEAKSGSIVVAVVDGELTVKRLKITGERVWLMPENPAYPPLEIRDGMALHLWGVVAHAVRSF